MPYLRNSTKRTAVEMSSAFKPLVNPFPPTTPFL